MAPFRHLILRSIAALLLVGSFAGVAAADIYELRIYTTHDGKLDALNARFRDHTVKLFKKHGIESVGYWVPSSGEESKNTLIYILKHKSREAAKASWKAFISDPEWKKAAKASRKDGPILSKAPESVYMKLTDYSPELPFDSSSAGEDTVYELRTYRTPKGKLDDLDARFRDHTIKLFARHGMASVAYWHPVDEPASQDTLIYILQHQSRDASKKSWPAFINDADWKKAFAESRVDGPLLREPPDSVYMKSTDYSEIK